MRVSQYKDEKFELHLMLGLDLRENYWILISIVQIKHFDGSTYERFLNNRDIYKVDFIYFIILTWFIFLS